MLPKSRTKAINHENTHIKTVLFVEKQHEYNEL